LWDVWECLVLAVPQKLNLVIGGVSNNV
jgi:hypothetical protein